MPALLRRPLAALFAIFVSLLLVACGGGRQKPAALPAVARLIPPPPGWSPQAQRPYTVPKAAAPINAAQVMDWAEQNFATLFPTPGRVQGYLDPYTYRYYPQTNIYLGISTGEENVGIYLYGAHNGWQIQRIAALSDYQCTVAPQTCVVTPGSVSVPMNASEGGSQQKDLSVEVPPVPGSLLAEVDAATPASWLGLQVIGSAVRLTASAVGLPAGTYSTGVKVRYAMSNGTTTPTVRVPVGFTVGAGLLTPAGQSVTWDAAATAATLKGALAVALSDGGAQAWTATSSAPWLTVTSSGTSPSTLQYSINLPDALSLANFADHTATVTIAAPGLTSVSAAIVLNKRLPFLNLAMPYGIPAGSTTRVVVRGEGFTQFTSPPTISGIAATDIQVLSDKLMAFKVAPASSGTLNLRISNATQQQTSAATLHVTAADGYKAGSTAVTDDKMFYVHDPVRRAIFSVSYFGNALFKYQFSGSSWTTTALPMTLPRNLGLSPDGKRLFVALENTLKEVNPDTMTHVATHPIQTTVSSLLNGVPMPGSIDNKLWIPSGGPVSIDLDAAGFATFTPQPAGSSEGVIASSDGLTILFTPNYGDWKAYSPVNGSVTNPMGQEDFGSDARLSQDGSRLLVQHIGAVYDANFQLLGQLPAAASGEFWSRMAITPNGRTIAALANQDGTVVRIDLFSTVEKSPGTTRFLKTGSIPVSAQSSDCSDGHYACEYSGRLVPAHDNKTIFWIGNKLLQAFKLP